MRAKQKHRCDKTQTSLLVSTRYVTDKTGPAATSKHKSKDGHERGAVPTMPSLKVSSSQTENKTAQRRYGKTVMINKLFLYTLTTKAKTPKGEEKKSCYDEVFDLCDSKGKFGIFE